MLNKSKVKLKTIQIEYKGTKKNIFNEMTYFSKNIFNSCVFTNNMFCIYKNKMYKKIYKLLINNKINISDNLFELSKLILQKYYKNYIFYYKLIKINNNIIFNFINFYISKHNIILNNSNIDKFIIDITKKIKKIVYYDKNSEFILLNNIINKIIKYFYNKNYYKVKNELINHKPLSINDQILINNVKNENYYFLDTNINYKDLIENTYNIKLKSEQYLYKMFVYDYCLDNIKDKLPADITLNIIDKYYESIKSYYAKLKINIKANKPKFLKKDDKYSLFYFPSSFKIIKNKIRLNVGNYIGKNFYQNLYRINEKKYCNFKDIEFNIDNKNKKQYQKLKEGYIKKNKIIDGNYLYINLPIKLKNKKIKLLQIQPYGNKFLININYEEEIDNYEKLNEEININNSISIDTGIKNLMTIYNPTGKQHIIKGGNIKTINEFYNKKISSLQSINSKEDKYKFNKLYTLLYERKNKINGEINKIIDILIKTYTNKKYFIIGYNELWKNNVNLGIKNNRIFYKIPYCRLLNKLKIKLEDLGKELIITEESYTSKCDSLNLEKICKHDKYDGLRKKRGLYISKIGKAINADLNGAINIMRKKINMSEIKGINLFNPIILKVHSQ